MRLFMYLIFGMSSPLCRYRRPGRRLLWSSRSKNECEDGPDGPFFLQLYFIKKRIEIATMNLSKNIEKSCFIQ